MKKGIKQRNLVVDNYTACLFSRRIIFQVIKIILQWNPSNVDTLGIW